MTQLGIRAQSLDRALPAIAGFIADRTGIPVIRGSRAMTDGKAIYLPRRRSEIDITEADLLKSVAFLYHEAGHMLHSDFTLAADNPLKRAITGALEDIRIEHLVISRFPAARRYLERLVALMVEQGVEVGTGFVEVKAEDKESSIVQWYILYRLRHEVLQQSPMAGIAAGAASIAKQRFPATMLTRLDALMFEVTNCKSEAEVFELADAIIEMIKEEKQKEEERNAQRQQQQQQESDQEQSQAQDQAGQNDGEQQQDASGDSSGDESGQPEGSGDPSKDGAAGQSADSHGDAGDDDTGKSSQGSQDGAGGFDAALDQLLNMSDEDIQEDLGEMLRQAINASAQAEGYDGNSISVPNVYRPQLRSSPVDIGKVRASINGVRTKVMQWMASAAEEDINHARAGMMIDSSRIWQGRLGGSIFTRKDEGIDLNAAVHFVVDRSGSMQSRIGAAVEAALGAIVAFDTPGIQTQVSLFPWYEELGGHRDEGVAVVKKWGEKPTALASRIGGLGTDGGTPMAEAILAATNSLVYRDETLKVIMVATDGMPDDFGATHEIIERARQAGIVVLGLGIELDPSPVFGAGFSASLHNIGELSGAMIKLLRATFETTRQTN